MSDCVFCKIIKGEIPSDKVYEDETFLAFRDLSPTAPVHVLLIPKQHIENIANMTDEEEAEHMKMFFAAVRKVAEKENITENGFRLVINNGDEGGQTVPHLHAHIIGGKALGWPPFKD